MAMTAPEATSAANRAARVRRALRVRSPKACSPAARTASGHAYSGIGKDLLIPGCGGSRRGGVTSVAEVASQGTARQPRRRACRIQQPRCKRGAHHGFANEVAPTHEAGTR